MTLLDITDTDRAFYADRIRDFLPERVVDIHAHCWLDVTRPVRPDGPPRAASWPFRVASENTVDSLAQTYAELLPGKQCGALVFGFPDERYDVEAANRYVSTTAGDAGYDALMLARPEWSAEDFGARLDAGRFLGAKVYLVFAPEYLPEAELRILDFAPRHQLAVLNARRAILMLHIPRAGRFRDPVNLHELALIEREFPDLQIVVAHVGRAYCDGDLGDGFARLAANERLKFDISANTNEHVFAEALRAVGPRRLLFGSDLPITRMRMRRICEDGSYVNLVPPGAYGDITDEPHMRSVSAGEADGLTFFLYEEIDAFRRAAEATGLTSSDVADVFHRNADDCLAIARQHYTRKQP